MDSMKSRRYYFWRDEFRELPGFVGGDGAVAVNDADPGRGVLASGIEIHGRKATCFAVGHSRINDLYKRIADAIRLVVLPDT